MQRGIITSGSRRAAETGETVESRTRLLLGGIAQDRQMLKLHVEAYALLLDAIAAQ